MYVCVSVCVHVRVSYVYLSVLSSLDSRSARLCSHARMAAFSSVYVSKAASPLVGGRTMMPVAICPTVLLHRNKRVRGERVRGKR
jgi:hypothetical protein